MRVSAVVFLAVAVANAAPINTATLTKDIQSTLNQLKAEAGPVSYISPELHAVNPGRPVFLPSLARTTISANTTT